MRLMTWNVNVLRTCLDYHPFSSMKKKNVEGLLDELGAQIYCFQEHKTRRNQLEKSMACPGPYDGFWTFPRSKTGYSGVCTYVDSRYCVPVKAEEGITGLLLDDKGATMRPGWTPEERIGAYPDMDEILWMDEEGRTFEPKRLEMEGRAVVTDHGLFVLFNLYCPNETNDTRRPYKMNFLAALQARVRALQAAGREVVVVGDINIMRAPIDSGEGGIRTSAEQHYEHPARVIFNNWIAPRGDMIDVVRESWPEREDMFTCWNTKLDARSANYGSRIDYILCTPGLRPWIKGGDILDKVFGSDHCPVFVDFHETITTSEGKELHLKDMLNPPDRPPTTAVVYPSDPPRTAPEPPRFATKFFDEFSGRQTTIKSFFGGGAVKRKLVDPSPEPVPSPSSATDTPMTEQVDTPMQGHAKSGFTSSSVPSTPFGMARAAFDKLDADVDPQPTASGSRRPPSATPPTNSRRRSETVDLTEVDGPAAVASSSTASRISAALGSRSGSATQNGKAKGKQKASGPSQATLASFFAPPASSKVKDPSEERIPRRSQSGSATPAPSLGRPPGDRTEEGITPNGAEEQDLLIAQAMAEAEVEQAEKRAATNAAAAPKWSELFAKKLPPMCTVHHKPCKDYIVKIPGPNKGKRFWLCSLPVGAGYDTGRSKRKREDVNPEFRCDFFLWDSANSRKEKPATKPTTGAASSPSARTGVS